MTCGCDVSSRKCRWDPLEVRTPLVNTRSSRVSGTPCNGPSGAPDIISFSGRRAAAIAASAVGVHTAFRRGLRASSRASTASITSIGETLRRAYILASSAAGVKQSSSFVLAMLVQPRSVALRRSRPPHSDERSGSESIRPGDGTGSRHLQCIGEPRRACAETATPLPVSRQGAFNSGMIRHCAAPASRRGHGTTGVMRANRKRPPPTAEGASSPAARHGPGDLSGCASVHLPESGFERFEGPYPLRTGSSRPLAATRANLMLGRAGVLIPVFHTSCRRTLNVACFGQKMRRPFDELSMACEVTRSVAGQEWRRGS